MRTSQQQEPFNITRETSQQQERNMLQVVFQGSLLAQPVLYHLFLLLLTGSFSRYDLHPSFVGGDNTVFGTSKLPPGPQT